MSIPIYPVLAGASVVAGLVLLAGLLAGQFRRGVVEELRAALASARDEIEIERGRGDRLEDELKRQAEKHDSEMAELRVDLDAVHAELELANRDRALMRELIAMQNKVPEALTQAIAQLTEQAASHVKEHVDARTEELKAEVASLKDELKAAKGD